MKNIIPYLKIAYALPGCKLKVEYEDGVQGIIDLSSWKEKGLFAGWNDEKIFQAFSITEKGK